MTVEYLITVFVPLLYIARIILVFQMERKDIYISRRSVYESLAKQRSKLLEARNQLVRADFAAIEKAYATHIFSKMSPPMVLGDLSYQESPDMPATRQYLSPVNRLEKLDREIANAKQVMSEVGFSSDPERATERFQFLGVSPRMICAVALLPLLLFAVITTLI